MWTMLTPMSRRRKMPLFSVWNSFLTYFDLFVRRKNKGPHYGLFAVCYWLNVSLRATLSHVLTVHGKQTNNHAVFLKTELVTFIC